MEVFFGSWKQHQTILTQIFISVKSDWGGFSVKFQWPLKQNKKVLHCNWVGFAVQISVISKKKGLHWNWVGLSILNRVVTTSNSNRNHDFSTQSQWGGYFRFLRTMGWLFSASKEQKTRYFAYSSGKWGAQAPPPGYATAFFQGWQKEQFFNIPFCGGGCLRPCVNIFLSCCQLVAWRIWWFLEQKVR